MRGNSLTAALSIAAIAYGAVSTTGCKRSDKNTAPVAQVETQTPPQTVNQPATVKGCLRAGDASDTFVLTASQAKDGETPATYLLMAANGVNLRDNVGREVEITGTISTQQAVETTTPATAPRNNKATGTSGKPAVETATQLDMRRLEVSTLNRVADKCDTK